MLGDEVDCNAVVVSPGNDDISIGPAGRSPPGNKCSRCKVAPRQALGAAQHDFVPILATPSTVDLDPRESAGSNNYRK